MDTVTQILNSITEGDAIAAEQLLPLVYAELRLLAARKLSREHPGQTLQPTALVHEAFMRLIGGAQPQVWTSRAHFFAAAAEAMRRILIESARRKKGRQRLALEAHEPQAPVADHRLPELQEALDQLSAFEPLAARVAHLRLFAGLSVEAAGELLDLSRATAYREWTFARAWLVANLHSDHSEKS